MLYDSHCHMDLMQEEELSTALKNAKENNISKIISCSTSFSSNEKNLELSKKYPQILSAIGLYPLDLIDLNELEIDKAFYFFKAEIKNAVAIGEVGMDFKYSTKEEEQQKQEKTLIRFIELSKEFDKPLILHSRFAQRQVLEVMIKNNAKKVLLHSFVDSKKLMKTAAEKGYFVSVGLNIHTIPEVQKNIESFPLENLLLETDSPIRFSGEKAYPAQIKSILDKVAEVKKMDPKIVKEQIEKNFKKLFL